jgi:hypothetical protein
MMILFHDYTSPASAVAVARVQRVIDEGMSARIVGTEAVGVDATLPVTVDLLAELDRVADAAAGEGIELGRPALVPPTVSAHLIEDVAREHGLDAVWRRRCYRAYWRDRSACLRRRSTRRSMTGSRCSRSAGASQAIVATESAACPRSRTTGR